MKKLVINNNFGEILRITRGVITAIATLMHPIKIGPNLDDKRKGKVVRGIRFNSVEILFQNNVKNFVGGHFTINEL